MQIFIRWPQGELVANLEDTPTSQALIHTLPLESSAKSWGDEIYFSVRLSANLEQNAQQVVDPGTVCFWTEGNALAIPFGPTPISEGNECRLVTACNVLGKVEGDPKTLSSVISGAAISVELCTN
ncbi:MAG: cyclophilin-like fold protein [Dehalococcoidia bacterium]|nr:cyclophilin-like fold protein [Dehalococcoidia bacterium]|tara:strand:+ start:62 stop:436 length:375 start_codon:yes stop_codon:yes gene_type:complete